MAKLTQPLLERLKKMRPGLEGGRTKDADLRGLGRLLRGNAEGGRQAS
jgi:hypothetical protein